MNVLIIPDKFKGSLTGTEVIEAIELGLRRFDSNIQVHSITASDGGDGFLDAIRKTDESIETIRCETTDPLGRSIHAEYGFDSKQGIAYVEMARASGMELLVAEERNPLLTSTLGTGTLIADALRRGAAKLYIGLGGSATNDGGIGIATALGYRFLDADGAPLPATGGALSKIDSIDASGVMPELDSAQVFAINDVANPLLGPEGAAAVYGPQKGADDAMVARLDQGLNRLQQIVQRDLKLDVADVPGAGAAGGTGYGLKAFLRAEFLSGIEFVLSLTGVESLLSGGTIDWIVTGEGKIDDQTAYGKLVRGVADVGEKYRVPVAALCGLLSLENASIEDLGLAKVRQIHDPQRPVEETIRRAKDLLVDAAEELLKAG
ncbi:glycerate kinase [Rhodopirellula sp. JC639]|uniref:glycerate kinase n=1 Tax=Stieleria mannarensis TaxID=2755585 RepID=UPI001C71B0E3|nr:glycerate kinase [Rhodopirellula sp. JC639]